jgi:hypothetical protein
VFALGILMPIDIFLLVKNRSRFERLLTLECKTEQAAFLFLCHRQILQEEYINHQENLFLGRVLSLHVQWVYLIDIYPSSGMKCFSAQSYLSNTRAHSKPLIVMPAVTLRTTGTWSAGSITCSLVTTFSNICSSFPW